MEATEEEANVLKDVLEITERIPQSSVKGIIICKCGNQIKYVRSKENNHLHLHWHCDKCKLGYHE